MAGVLLQNGVVQQSIDRLLADVTAAIPNVVSGVLFLLFAVVLVRLALFAIDTVLGRLVPPEADIYRRFVRSVAAAFLWFAVGLTFLAIVGLGAIAASLGTAAGFLALGVSYALSNMIADAVAGVYLVRDPDFAVGDEITAGGVTGTVKAIELRKTRFDVGDDTVVRANAEIEKQWTKLEDAD